MKKRPFYRQHYRNAKERARKLLQLVVRHGLIKVPSKCKRCKVPCRPDAHHKNYSRPFDVLWLCRRCHRQEHLRPTTIRRDARHSRTKGCAPKQTAEGLRTLGRLGGNA